MMTETVTTYWVCEDCFAEHAGILEEYVGDRNQLLSLIPASATIAAGLPADEHSESCPVWLGDPNRGDVPVAGAECDCESRTFTWTPCEGCGAPYGGSREALTVWEPVA